MQSDFATAVKKAQYTTPGFDEVKPTNITDFPFRSIINFPGSLDESNLAGIIAIIFNG